MAEYRVPTQAEINRLMYMQGLQGKTQQQIIDENLARGIAPIPENVFQRIAGGARATGEFVNRAGSAADIAKLFPGYKPEAKVTIPTGYNFAPKQDPMGGVVPGGLQTQNVNLGQVLGAIKPADVLGISGAERAYSDIGMGKAPQPFDVVDTLGLGAVGLGATSGLLKATKGLPVGMSIQEAKGLLQTAPKSDIGFYSAVEQAAMASPRKSGAGQAFLNDIMKGQDVRADEIKWMGLDDYLKGKQNVTKQEVQDYIANNRVEVKEVAFGNLRNEALNKEQSAAQQLVNLIDSQDGSSIRLAGMQGKVFSDEALYALQDGTLTPKQFPPEFQAAANNYLTAYQAAKQVENTPTKFGSYTLPGGENYRELLLTMPTKFNNQINIIEQQIKTQEEVIRQALRYGEENPDQLANMQTKRKIAEEKISNLQNELNQIGSKTPEYKSAHFDQPNILAHLRVNDRVDADGKKMLLIEEVQSDWHQAGREKGYAGAESKAAETAFKQYSKDLADKYDLNPEQNLAMYATMKRMQPDEVAKYEQLQSAWTTSKGGVPDAPFKDTWYQLALKRAVQYAAENGYDRIGLTTGSQQASRFNLSKQVDNLLYSKNPDGTYRVSAQVQGRGQMIGEAIPEGKLSDYVGKEVAEKMSKGAGKQTEVAGKYDPVSMTSSKNYMTELSGVDLKIGGEGMKKYYDEIYPKFLDKYGKKWGARVGETKISADGTQESIRYIDVTPEMKASVSKGQPLFQALPAIPATGLLATQDENR